MPIDENEVQQIVVSLLTPQITRVLAYCVSALGSVGITIIPSNDSALKIATAIVTVGVLVAHTVYANYINKANAKSAFVQGAAAAGMTLAKDEVPEVVGAASAKSLVPSSGPTIATTVYPSNTVPQPPPPKPLTDAMDK